MNVGDLQLIFESSTLEIPKTQLFKICGIQKNPVIQTYTLYLVSNLY